MSVVVPAFNERKTIEATVRSVVSGGHAVEVVVVDDGSTDGTADLVEGLGLAGVRVVRQENGGKPAALNTGVAAATRDIVVMMDAVALEAPALWKHRHAVIERGRSGHVGRVGLLITAVFQVLLPLLAPMVDVYLVYGLIFLDPVTTAAIRGAVLGLQPASGVLGTTLATDPRELPVGGLVYYAPLQRYLVMEDDCDTCIAEWGADRTAHLDLWLSGSDDPAVLPCEEALTPAGPVPVEVNPPPGRPVDPRPLFDHGRCWPDT